MPAQKIHDVVIAGGGPTGMTLAGELALAGIDVLIVERRETPELAGSRAGGLQSRTLEMLDQRGIADRFVAEGQPAQVHGFAGAKLDISDFPTRFPFGLGLWQAATERILLGWIEELSVPILRGRAVTGFTEDDAGIAAALDNGDVLRARYLVGCDGGRSAVRKAAGIDFPGWDATVTHLLAEVEFDNQPELGTRSGTIGIGRIDYKIVDGKIVYAESGPARVMLPDERPDRSSEPTLDDIRAGLVTQYGEDFGLRSARWITSFSDAARQAASYRKGRVLLAGDAAHVHYPVGGHGLNLGVQDAMNLGWKLARVAKGVSPESLLDTYHGERHPVAARVLRETMGAVAANRPDDRSAALRDVIGDVLAVDAARKHLAGLASGLALHYDMGKGHPLLGRRMPDVEIGTAEGPRRVFSLLHDAQPVLLNLGQPGVFATASSDVNVVDAIYDGPWDLPVVGMIPAPSAVLVRPDGYVAWVGEGNDTGLSEAIARWFGKPLTPPPTPSR
jgi:3-(3-hydroxy-phenyl)propionate hydroxylase